MESTKYWVHSNRGGYEFTRDFYNLGLTEKYRVIENDLPNFDESTLIRLSNAILQHSSPEAKKELPCKGVRKLSKEARLADLQGN